MKRVNRNAIAKVFQTSNVKAIKRYLKLTEKDNYDYIIQDRDGECFENVLEGCLWQIVVWLVGDCEPTTYQ